MARTINRLTARQIETLKKPGLHADGGGLYLRIDAAGAKRWTFIFQWRGKRKEMGLGPVRTIRLAEARDAAELARKRVLDGINPIEARIAAKAALNGKTFGEVSDELIASLKPGWKNPKHAEQWEMTLREYVPFRDKPVNAIDTADVLSALEPIWAKTPETAARLRGRIERVLDAAKAKDLRTGENPARWRGHLSHLLAKQQKLSRGHHAAMPFEEVPAFMADLRKRNSMSARALEFTILTAARTSEAIEARWQEIDLEAKVWTVPAIRMKGGKEHRVPLEKSALQVIMNLRLERTKPSDFVFPGPRRGKPLSTAAMDAQLERMGRDDVTVHGFRSSFRDWVGETRPLFSELAEMALSHVVGTETERAYRRGDAIGPRRKLMGAWDRYLASPVPKRRGEGPDGQSGSQAPLDE